MHSSRWITSVQCTRSFHSSFSCSLLAHNDSTFWWKSMRITAGVRIDVRVSVELVGFILSGMWLVCGSWFQWHQMGAFDLIQFRDIWLRLGRIDTSLIFVRVAHGVHEHRVRLSWLFGDTKKPRTGFVCLSVLPVFLTPVDHALRQWQGVTHHGSVHTVLGHSAHFLRPLVRSLPVFRATVLKPNLKTYVRNRLSNANIILLCVRIERVLNRDYVFSEIHRCREGMSSVLVRVVMLFKGGLQLVDLAVREGGPETNEKWEAMKLPFCFSPRRIPVLSILLFILDRFPFVSATRWRHDSWQHFFKQKKQHALYVHRTFLQLITFMCRDTCIENQKLSKVEDEQGWT